MTMEQAEELLDYLKQAKSSPELILEKLFTYGIEGMNFLYQVQPDNKYIYDFCKEQLSMLPVFLDCIIEQNSFEFEIYLQSECRKYFLNIPIITIDGYAKTFCLSNQVIEECRKAIENPLPEIPKEEKLSEDWMIFSDYSLMKKPYAAIQTFQRINGRLSRKIRGCLRLLLTPTEKVRDAFDKEVKFIQCVNERSKERYKEELERQQELRAIGRGMVALVEKKQREITEFLLDLGYCIVEKK